MAEVPGVIESAETEPRCVMAIERKDSDVKNIGPNVYLVKVLWKLSESDKGKMVVIDVDSGDYEADADEAAARKRLLSRRPAARTWTEEFQGLPAFRGGWMLSYPNGYTI